MGNFSKKFKKSDYLWRQQAFEFDIITWCLMRWSTVRIIDSIWKNLVLFWFRLSFLLSAWPASNTRAFRSKTLFGGGRPSNSPKGQTKTNSKRLVHKQPYLGDQLLSHKIDHTELCNKWNKSIESNKNIVNSKFFDDEIQTEQQVVSHRAACVESYIFCFPKENAFPWFSWTHPSNPHNAEFFSKQQFLQKVSNHQVGFGAD